MRPNSSLAAVLLLCVSLLYAPTFAQLVEPSISTESIFREVSSTGTSTPTFKPTSLLSSPLSVTGAPTGWPSEMGVSRPASDLTPEGKTTSASTSSTSTSTSTSTTTTITAGSGSKTNNAGAIAAAFLGGVVFTLVAIGIFTFALKRHGRVDSPLPVYTRDPPQMNDIREIDPGEPRNLG